MAEFFLDYGLFLAKTLTLVVAILFVVGTILVMAMKSKSTQEGHLVISKINEKFDEICEQLQRETLSKKAWKKWQKSQKHEKSKHKKEKTKPRLFVTRFEGDIRASELSSLREVITSILTIATPKDEVLVVLDSGGGFVHSYGLAASQLHRLKENKIHLTVAIDKVAASGGYMMSCVANKILAAPFAVVGSIGVMAQMPNFNRLLKKHDIDFELHTAGEFKRTLTLFGENTDKARNKFQEEIDETHILFKDFILEQRPSVDIDKVATGEHWHAKQALSMDLVDELRTSDDFISEQVETKEVFEISYEFKQKISDKIAKNIAHSLYGASLKLLSKLNPNRMK